MNDLSTQAETATVEKVFSDQLCACCQQQKASKSDKLAMVWLVSSVAHKRSWRGRVEQYCGYWIRWFVCESCARKYPNREHFFWAIAAVLLWLLTFLVEPTMSIAATVVSIGSMFFTINHLRTSTSAKAQNRRDKCLQKQLRRLFKRDDFQQIYGERSLHKEATVKSYTRSEFKGADLS